jgi:hypothetical protein
MAAEKQLGEWILLAENPTAVLSALERGETDGILPAACKFMDRFAQFALSAGIPRVFDEFADHRERKWITPFFFCNVLLHKSLLRLTSLASIGPFLFSSPDVMRTLGFQMRQIKEGFYKVDGLRPFNEEAMSDFFALCDLSDYLASQKKGLVALLASHPEILSDGSLIMDTVDTRIPGGNRHKETRHLESCVLCAVSQGELLPILWNIGKANEKADINQGKELIREAMPIIGERAKRLIVDRGFISGEWLTKLKTKRGLDTVVGLKSDMILHQDMIALSKHRDTKWIKVDPPKFHKGEIPTRRICYLSELDLWEECKVPLSGIVIRDKYADRIEYQTVVTTDLSASARQIHKWIRSRWDIEETFMTESRYGCLNRIGSCREPVAAALVHFSLLAYTLLRLFARQEKVESKYLRPRVLFGGVELVAYWRGYYAIIFPSELVELVARCAPSWGERLPSILEKLRTVECPP